MYTVSLLSPAAGSTGVQPWIGGSGVFNVLGTFGGASVSLEYSADDGVTWTNVGAALTAAGAITFSRAAGQLRAVISAGANAMLTGTATRSVAPLLITTADGATGSQQWPGGAGLLSVAGSFGGGSVQLERLGPDGQTWLPVGAALTAAGTQSFTLPRGDIQATVTAGTGVSLSAIAEPIPTILA